MPRRQELVIDYEGQLTGKLAERFAAEAERRGKTPADLAADIFAAVIEHDLFRAVLDD